MKRALPPPHMLQSRGKAGIPKGSGRGIQKGTLDTPLPSGVIGRFGKSLVGVKRQLPAPLAGDGGQPKAKKSRSKPVTLPELEEQMTAALNGSGRYAGDSKSELNTFIQMLSRRSMTKADLTTNVERGPPLVMSLQIPAFDIQVDYVHEGDPETFDSEMKKDVDKRLSEQAIAELLERVRSGEVTLPEESQPDLAPPQTEVPRTQLHVNVGGPKSALNSALQKLLGRPSQKTDRIFEIDRQTQRAVLRLPSLMPPLEVDCFARQETLKGDIEQELAQIALDTLVDAQILVYHPDEPGVQAYTLGPEVVAHEGEPPAEMNKGREAFHQRAKGTLPAAKNGAEGPGIQHLREFTDAWEAAPGDEYQEHYTLARGEAGAMEWNATLMLHIEANEGPLMEGQGTGRTQEEAREAAASELIAQIEQATGGDPSTRPAPSQQIRAPGGGPRPRPPAHPPAGKGARPEAPAQPRILPGRPQLRPPAFNGRPQGGTGAFGLPRPGPGPRQPAGRPPPGMLLSKGKGKGKFF